MKDPARRTIRPDGEMRGSCGRIVCGMKRGCEQAHYGHPGLERIHGLAHTRRATRHGSNEPFAFIVAAQEAVELRQIVRFADLQQQMALFRFTLRDGYIQ